MGTPVSYSKDPTDPTQNVFALDLSALESAGNIKRHPDQDVALVKIAILSAPGEAPKEGESCMSAALSGVNIKQ